MLQSTQLRRKGIHFRLPKKVKIASAVGLLALSVPLVALACEQKTHWKMIYDENKIANNFGVEIDVCGYALHFNGTDRLHNHLYQKFLDTTPQDAYHIVYSDGYEGSTSQVINGVNVKMRLNRTNTDRGFYSLKNDVEVFSIDHGVYDDTVKLTNDGGEVFMLNFAKTYTVDNTLDHAQVMSKFVADCNEVPEGTPFKPKKK